MNSSARPDTPGQSNSTWLLDIGYPSTRERRFTVLCIVEQRSGACLAMQIQETFQGDDVARVLEHLASVGGPPRVLKVDCSASFSDTAIVRWAADHKTQIVRFSAHMPAGKGLIERAMRSAREGERLPAYPNALRRVWHDG
jgi:hypothetical protein